MKTSIKKIMGLTFASLLSASAAFALPAVSGTPGSLPGNLNFGGTGIPAHHVMLDQSYAGLTLGLTAHQRYVGPNLANDGNGTFFASAGESSPGLGLWNFGFQIENTAGLASLSYKLTFGSDPANYISFNPVTVLGDNKPSTVGNSLFSAGNSQNLGFYTPFITYDPNAAGNYAVVLEAFSLTDTAQTTAVAKSAINVNVSSVPDAGSTLALMGVAFAGIAGLRRKFND